MAQADHGSWLTRLLNFPEVGLFWYGSTHRNWSVSVPRGLPEHLVYFVVVGSCDGEAVVGSRGGETGVGSRDGEAGVGSGEQRIQLSPGSLMWLKPEVAFNLRATSPRPITLYRFRLLPVPGEEPPLGPAVVLPDAWELRQPFDTLVSELTLALPFREQRIRAVMLLLFSGILRLAERQHGAGHPLEQQQRTLLERYADERIGQRIAPEELAALLNLSPEYFTRRFRQTFGVPPKVWLVRRRVHHAAARLDEEQDSIAQVAASLGYPDVFLFSRQFKSVMGVSPRAYRAR